MAVCTSRRAKSTKALELPVQHILYSFSWEGLTAVEQRKDESREMMTDIKKQRHSGMTLAHQKNVFIKCVSF